MSIKVSAYRFALHSCATSQSVQNSRTSEPILINFFFGNIQEIFVAAVPTLIKAKEQ
jgi:hypothetical protein